MESFGLAALEAMACEVVPIATRVGGVPEVIEHGKGGYLADVGDVDTMARYAIELLNDEPRLREMGREARVTAKSRFCASKIVPQYESSTGVYWSVPRKKLRDRFPPIVTRANEFGPAFPSLHGSPSSSLPYPHRVPSAAPKH